LDPDTNEIVKGGIEEQTKRVLDNLNEVLTAGGSSFQNVIKTTVFIKNMADFAAMNTIYGSYFTEPFPARSTIEVARLPKDALIEIEAIAAIG
jgi:2-iminobutanoate/2-iminopropanoate deaminase